MIHNMRHALAVAWLSLGGKRGQTHFCGFGKNASVPFSLLSWRRGGLRLLVPAMAGVAGDVLLAVGELSVDVLRQDDHLARDVFLGVLVTGKIAFHVTELALHGERESVGLHGSPDIR